MQTVDHAMLSSSVLIANDLRASGQIVDGNTIDRISALLPFSQNLRPSTGPNQIARSKLLLTRIACREALRKRKDYICLEEEFDLHAGVRVADFLSIIFGAWIRFHYLKVENLPFDRKDYGLTTDHFQKTSVSDEHVLKALRRISKSAETFIEECTNANAADHHDFGLIQRSPLLELEDHFLCLDPEFLIDKAGVAIYWTMRESFPGNLQSKLSSYWGSVVDEYVKWLFETCYGGSGLLLLRPEFANGDEACDLWLLEGRQLSIVEVKNNLLSAKAKYGFRADALEQELRTKTIDKKGVGQLYPVIQRFLQGEAVNCVDTNQTIHSNQVRLIRPVVAFMDESFLSPGINGYINNASPSRPRRKGSGVTVTPTFTMSIADLEDYVRASTDVNLATALQSAYDNNRPMDGGLGLMDVPALRNAHFAHTAVQTEFDHFEAEMKELFFGTHEAD